MRSPPRLPIVLPLDALLSLLGDKWAILFGEGGRTQEPVCNLSKLTITEMNSSTLHQRTILFENKFGQNIVLNLFDGNS